MFWNAYRILWRIKWNYIKSFPNVKKIFNFQRIANVGKIREASGASRNQVTILDPNLFQLVSTLGHRDRNSTEIIKGIKSSYFFQISASTWSALKGRNNFLFLHRLHRLPKENFHFLWGSSMDVLLSINL